MPPGVAEGLSRSAFERARARVRIGYLTIVVIESAPQSSAIWSTRLYLERPLRSTQYPPLTPRKSAARGRLWRERKPENTIKPLDDGTDSGALGP